MKKLFFSIIVMLFSCLSISAQAKYITIQDAISLYTRGFDISIINKYGYKPSGEDEYTMYFSKDCTYVVDEYDVKQVKANSSLVTIESQANDIVGVNIVVFTKSALDSYANQIKILGFVKDDEHRDKFGYQVTYVKPKVKYAIVLQEEKDGVFPFKITIQPNVY